MKRFVIILFLAQAFAFAAEEPYKFESSMDAMGTTFTVVLYGDPKLLEPAAEAALEEVKRLDQKLSNYRPQSEWSTINRLAGKQEVKISPEMFDLLAACQDYSRQSEGAFDITVGPLMKLWGFFKGSGHLPHRAAVKGVLSKVGYKKMILDRGKSTVRFARDGMEIDPGGIGKGYAVDRMVEILKSSGISSALVSGGGSTIYALGSPPNEDGWMVEIRHPKDRRKVAQQLRLKNESMSTSGNYEKYFWAEGRIYSHIMDPRTGFPSTGMYSASVVTARAIDSEAWTKPAYINGRAWASTHMPKGFRVFLCEDKGEAVCAWLQ